MVELATTIWADGPSSTPYEPQKSQIRQWGTWLENQLAALNIAVSAVYIRGTLAQLVTIVGATVGQVGIVVSDDDIALRGVYVRESTGWVKKLNLPADAAYAYALQAEAARDLALDYRDGALVAKTGAEAARDIAAGYASDAVSQGNVPIYATVAGLASLSIPVGIVAIRLNGYYAAGDGGGALYKRIAAPSSPKAWQKQSSDGAWWEIAVSDANLLQFGCRLGTFGSDNTVATANTARLLDAVDWMVSHADIRQRMVKVPDGTIELMDFVLPAETPYISFVGATWNNSVWLFKNLSPGIGCRVNSIESSFWFVHMLQYITGVSGDPTIIPGRTLLHLQRPAHPELPVAQRQEIDVDATVMFCKFSRAAVGVEIVGRGLRAESNLISVCDRGIKLGWGGPDDYQYGTGNQSYEAGFRAFQLQNNRFHSYVYAAITNDGAYADKLQGCIITGNYADIGRPIFDGVLIDGEISATVVTQTVTEAIRLRHGSKRYSISGSFSGSVEASRTPVNLIRLFGDQHAGSFEGLTLSRSRQHAILHDGTRDGSTGTGVCTAMDFDGILFDEVCLDGGNYCPICILGPNHTGNIRNIVLDGDVALTGILRTSVASTAFTVENARRYGAAASTPYHVGAGSRYIDATYSQEYRFGADGNGRILRGTGSPAGVVSAFPGSMYIRTDGSSGSTFYVKVSGNDASGWYVGSLTLA